jgi:hypothetical protein
LLRHSLSTGNQESRARLMNMLSATVKVDKTETSFKTLTLPESARSQPKEADVILPLLFEIALVMNIQDQRETVMLRAPGTVSGTFQRPCDHARAYSSWLLNLTFTCRLAALSLSRER